MACAKMLSNSTTATVFMMSYLAAHKSILGYTALSPIANPYDTPPAIALGFDGALVVSGAAQATLDI